MTPRTLDVPELSTINPDETLREWRRRVKPAKRTRRLFWWSLLDAMFLNWKA
jgi:hypothetical protein